MLVILAMFPITSPSESFRLEEAVAEVALLNHINMMLAAVEVGTASGWLHHILAVFQPFVIGVIERVDIDGKSFAMLRYGMGMRDETEVETGGVVGSHRPFVVGIPVVDEPHSLYRIFRLVELSEDIEYISGYRLVYHHFAHYLSAVLVPCGGIAGISVHFLLWYSSSCMSSPASGGKYPQGWERWRRNASLPVF